MCYNCFTEKSGESFCTQCGYGGEPNISEYPLALNEGSILANQYVVGRVLGQGGFGITYLALDRLLGVRVAIKEFLPEGMAVRTGGTANLTVYSGERQESFAYGVEQFIDEARALAKFIGNRNIAAVRSYFNENNTAYFVMEYVDGTSFKNYIASKGGSVDYADAVRVLAPVMDALSAVHAAGMIHRDVTPDNIYITSTGEVKLLDFGSARYSLGDKSRSLEVVLKAGYAPREQYTRKGRQGPFTDVYSLAASFYAAITGYLPPEALERIDEDVLVAISARGIKIPGGLEDAIMKGLEVNAADRFQSMAEFKSEVIRAVQVVPQPAPIPQPVAQPVVSTPIAQPVAPAPIAQPVIPNPAAQPIAQPVVPEPIAQPAPSGGSKKPLLIALTLTVSAVVICFGIVMFNYLNQSAAVPSGGGGGGGGGGAAVQITTRTPPPDTPVLTTEPVTTEPVTEPATEPAFMLPPFNVRGSTPGNISNDGLVVQQGDYLYFARGRELNRRHIDGSDEALLCDDRPSYINVVGGWIYYRNGHDENKLYKIRTNGEDRTKLNDDNSWYINVVDDWIYYRNDRNGNIYKISTEGTGRERLNDDNCRYINVIDGRIYYRNGSDGNTVYVMNTDGSGRTKLNEDQSFSLNVVDGWIYYRNMSDGNRLYRMRVNGSAQMKLNDDESFHINVMGDWVYYRNGNEDMFGRMYRVRLNGRDREHVVEDDCFNINTSEGHIYYLNRHGEIYQVMLNEGQYSGETGAADNNRQIIEDFMSRYPSIFSLGVYRNDVLTNWDWEPIDSNPLIYIRFDGEGPTNWHGGYVYHRDGSLVPEDAPFLQGGFLAIRFELCDIDSDGIPEILILFAAETYGFVGLYKYIDSQYQNVGFMLWPDFYADGSGRIYMVESDHGNLRLSSITFTRNGADINLMSDWQPYEDFNYNFIRDDTRIEPLSNLRDEISLAVSRRLD